MMPGLHPEQHPDAELLNAFAEQELAEQERLQVLDHLAVCERCRAVLFVAQLSATPFLVARQAELQSRPGGRPNRLTLAWSVAAAVAALLLLTLTIRLAPGPQTSQTARLEPSAPVPKAAPVPPPPSAGPVTGDRQPASPALRAQKPLAPAAPAAVAPARALPPAFAAAETMSRAKSIEFDAPAAPPAAEVLPSRRTEQAEPRPRAMAARPAPQARLPNGQTILSKAQAGSLSVALDLGGALYWSDDGGTSWSPVPAQWNGRAVKVTALIATAWAKNGSHPLQSLQSSPAAVFELQNEQGTIWTSSDGRHWSAQSSSR